MFGHDLGLKGMKRSRGRRRTKKERKTERQKERKEERKRERKREAAAAIKRTVEFLMRRSFAGQAGKKVASRNAVGDDVEEGLDGLSGKETMEANKGQTVWGN